MTSKRLGILVFAFVAVWSLVGLGGVSSDAPVLNVLTVSSANAATEGDPDEYTGEPGVGNPEEESGSTSTGSNGSTKRLNLDEVGETLFEALSALFGSWIR